MYITTTVVDFHVVVYIEKYGKNSWVQFHQRSTRSFYVCNLREAFLCLHFRFLLYWRKTVGAKAARKTLVKLSPEDLVDNSPKQNIDEKNRLTPPNDQITERKKNSISSSVLSETDVNRKS
jgi:hypothetical protein